MDYFFSFYMIAFATSFWGWRKVEKKKKKSWLQKLSYFLTWKSLRHATSKRTIEILLTFLTLFHIRRSTKYFTFLLKVSISLTLYVWIFRTNVVFFSYMYVDKTKFVRKISTFNVDEIDLLSISSTLYARFCTNNVLSSYM